MRIEQSFLTSAFALALITSVHCSSGDTSFLFQQCLNKCITEVCQTSQGPPKLSLPLRLTRWSCEDNCKYECMHGATEYALDQIRLRHRNGARVEQFYGKWPFWRLLGMQEPASVIFSLLNLAAHYVGLHWVRKKIPDGHPMKKYIVTWGNIGINAWIWSAVFHTRDTPQTEKLDYFSAALSIMYSLFFAVVRLFHLYVPGRRHYLVQWAWTCSTLYILHVAYLSLIRRFDYSYNMVANVIVGFAHLLTWLSYSLPSTHIYYHRHRSYKPKHVDHPTIFALITTCATMLEIFDFAPWALVIDAHSLWHLSTAPITIYWYRFLILDALDEGWRIEKV